MYRPLKLIEKFWEEKTPSEKALNSLRRTCV
jgi:hypothetical protein